MAPGLPSNRAAGGDLLLRRRFDASRLVEALMFVVSLSALLMIALILLFVGREALPLVLGHVNAALVRETLPVEEALRLPPERLRAYLGLTRREFMRLETQAIRDLAQLRVESQAAISPSFRNDPDATANTVAWRYLVPPHQWTGHDRPAYVWQPISLIPKYNVVPLVLGSLKVTFVSLVVAVPLALAAALYVAQLAPSRLRAWAKPAIELLAGLPAVVVGFLALVVLANLLEGPTRAVADHLGVPASRLNALVAGLALGLAVVPVVFSVAEDALAAVPRSYAEAALALGASRWQAAWQVTVPAALPGLVAAVMLGFGRAFGETMIVLMASGNAALTSWNILQPTRTMAATVAAEMAEAVFGGAHYRMLFLVGTLLVLVTFVSNSVASLIIERFQRRPGNHP